MTPTDDGAEAAVFNFGAGRRQTDGAYVVGESNGLFHAQDGDVVDESRVDVARMDENVRNDAHLFVR